MRANRLRWLVMLAEHGRPEWVPSGCVAWLTRSGLVEAVEHAATWPIPKHRITEKGRAAMLAAASQYDARGINWTARTTKEPRHE